MKLDTQLTNFDLGEVLTQTERFTRIGFDGLWTFEAAHDPFLPLAVAAQIDSRVDLGTNISVAFGRSPFAMAQTAWDLQRASEGRFHLGLGTQVRAHIERRFSMPFEHPAARVTDYIRCVRAIWDHFQEGTRPDYKGEFYQFTLMNPFFQPGPIEHPRIPIYLAGVNPRMCRAAGEVADGFHVHPMVSAGYLEEVIRPALDQGARSRGRTVDELVLYAPIFSITGETQQQWDRNEREVRAQIAFYASTPNYRTFLEYHDLTSLGKELSKKARAGEWSEMADLIPESFVEKVAIIAKPVDLAVQLRRRFEGLLQRVSLYFPIGGEEAETKWTNFVNSFRDSATE